MNHLQANALATKIGNTWPNSRSATVEAWTDALLPLDHDTAHAAYVHHRRTDDRMPTIAQLLAAVAARVRATGDAPSPVVPALTDEQRVRAAAACATVMADLPWKRRARDARHLRAVGDEPT